MRTQDNQIEMRKRVGQYSYESKDAIGKGYSSVVYRGVNDSSGTLSLTQDNRLL